MKIVFLDDIKVNTLHFFKIEIQNLNLQRLKTVVLFMQPAY